ncbi:hypothetical protein ABFX02_07G096000 [Erythranthe guttata]
MSLTQIAADEFTSMETREASPSHFLIKIESFYNNGIDKYETKEFVAGEYKWKLIIYPTGDNIVGKDSGYVSVYLAMADTSSLPANWEVNVVFNIFLFNQISANYLCSLGRTIRFQPMKSEWGFSKFISKKIMSEPSNGYLVDDNCVFGAEVFVVKREAEDVTQCFYLRDVGIPFKRYWMIPNFSKLGDKDIWKSQEFTAGCKKWMIKLYPKGNGEGAGSHVSIYLCKISTESVVASYTVCIKNQDYRDLHKKRTLTDGFFTATTIGKGWPTYMEIATINNPNNGFLVNDTCLLHLEISSVEDVAQ